MRLTQAGIDIAAQGPDLVYRVLDGTCLLQRQTKGGSAPAELAPGAWFTNWCPGVLASSLSGRPLATLCILDLSALMPQEPIAARRIIQDVVAAEKLGLYHGAG